MLPDNSPGRSFVASDALLLLYGRLGIYTSADVMSSNRLLQSAALHTQWKKQRSRMSLHANMVHAGRNVSAAALS